MTFPKSFVVVQSLGHVQLCDPMDCSLPGFPVLHHLKELAQTHVHWVGDVIQPFHPQSPPCPPASNVSGIRVFPKESALCIRWSKYWSFRFSINLFSEYSGLISFRMDWFDLLAIQGTLKSLLQHYHSKSSILQCSAFFMVQLSHPYMTTGKTIALIIQKTLSRHSHYSPLFHWLFLSPASLICIPSTSLVHSVSNSYPRFIQFSHLLRGRWSSHHDLPPGPTTVS